MNELEQELLNYEYKNPKVKKWIHIYKRTKKQRIKNKQFVKILTEAIKERKIIKLSDIVLLDIEVYNLLQDTKKGSFLLNIGKKEPVN